MKKLIFTLGGLGGFAYYSTLALPKRELEGEPYSLLPKTIYLDNPNKHFITSTPSKIGIIGGGISGCITAKTLSQQGYNVEILDKNPSVGGLWYSNYDNSGLQFHRDHYNLPDFKFSDDCEILPKQKETAAFIKAYAEKFGILPYVISNTTVKSIKQNPDLSWTVFTNNGDKKYDFLVVCTGPYNKPYMPKFKGIEKFKGKVLHSSEFINAENLCKGKNVIVVGSGKSAFDILAQAKRYGANVHLIMRKTHWLVPPNMTILGIPLGYFTASRLAGFFLDPFYSERTWKDSIISSIGALYWFFVVSAIKKGIPENLMPVSAYKTEKLFRGGARDSEIYEEIGKKIVVLTRGAVEELTENGVALGKKEFPADVIICATGFEREYLDLPAEKDGMWMYRNTILPNVKNLAVVGIINTYCNPLYTNIQAIWLAEVLRGRVRLPGEYKMTEDIKERKEYTRTVLPDEPTLSFSWFPYPMIDQFLNDMGISTQRKKNRLLNWFEPIKPNDYVDVVTHRE